MDTNARASKAGVGRGPPGGRCDRKTAHLHALYCVFIQMDSICNELFRGAPPAPPAPPPASQMHSPTAADFNTYNAVVLCAMENL
ncbi:hypothetical protein EVAR_53568_1 [Eumeta japonica]|uniref:Uncharacterized protein n=1 Tax=Eumeta variegata TaxID=151549 RepID=A0A4C1YMD3_EUMVA|nr:hypothetical protein EVAR_53568_1 [Eumeta japonica]